MTREQLKERVRKLPMQPGVYMHKDKTGKVIYVGKAKLLKNRVSNYFQPPERLNAKTRQLVSHIDDFDIIVTDSEFEALVLENSMIKKYKPTIASQSRSFVKSSRTRVFFPAPML